LLRKQLLSVLEVLERDIRSMMASNMRMKEVYARLLRKAQNDATRSNYEVKKRMKKAGIKIIEELKEEDKTVTKFLVRGYRHEFKMLWSLVKVEIEIKMAAYMEVNLADPKTNP